MSETNVDLLRRGYDAFTRGDIEAALGLMTDDIQFVVAENSPYYRGTPYVGKQEIAEKLFARVGTEWDGYLNEITRHPDLLSVSGKANGWRDRTDSTTGAESKPECIRRTLGAVCQGGMPFQAHSV